MLVHDHPKQATRHEMTTTMNIDRHALSYMIDDLMHSL